MGEIIANRWWAVLPSAWLGASRPKGVERLGSRYVLFRDESGVAHAAHAACPHRGADLSLGRVVSGQLECPYHGFCFNREGACTKIPCEGSGAKIPPRMKLKVVPVREAHGFLWIYSGVPGHNSDVSWVPEAPTPNPRGVLREMLWEVPFSRVMEGMLDMHHFPFAHRSFSPASMTRLDPYEASLDGNGVLRTRGTLRAEDKAPETGFTFQMDVAFPGVLYLRLSQRIGGVVVCAPVDDARTWIGLYYEVDVPWLGVIPGINKLAAWLSVWSELRFIQPDDYKLLKSSSPRGARVEEEVLIHADKGIALWHSLRRRAMNDSISEEDTRAQAQISTPQHRATTGDP
jgi:phenylpropionate dioxygenase-like ring-hydroxylating dioxygenase large terminal subunit